VQSEAGEFIDTKKGRGGTLVKDKRDVLRDLHIIIPVANMRRKVPLLAFPELRMTSAVTTRKCRGRRTRHRFLLVKTKEGCVPHGCRDTTTCWKKKKTSSGTQLDHARDFQRSEGERATRIRTHQLNHGAGTHDRPTLNYGLMMETQRASQTPPTLRSG
jgi:hypothetical protein